ncbi:MAG: hypothetical protein IKR68_03005 [Lachnospiraceae bacterium]|nr:hypothetical protein [Lachnospiraceae bacterium]
MFEPLTDAQKLKIGKYVNKVLHVQGNSPKGDVLAIALVLDCSLPRDFLCEASKDILTFLRREGKPYLNLRINLIKWRSDTEFVKYVTSYPEILMDRAADEADIVTEEKHWDALTEQLKKFYARSRVVLILLDHKYGCIDPEAVAENLKPFLHRKTVCVYPEGGAKYPLDII